MLDLARSPRTVFDESGTYTISEAGLYEVTSRSVQKYHEVVFATRDLRTAHEMVEECCRTDLDRTHPLLEQSLWISAVISYSKPFKTNNARQLFDAKEFVRSNADGEMLNRHHYLITLRDKMIAHDDALGEGKQVTIGLPYREPKNHLEIGIDPTSPRIVSLGSNIAREVEPHFRSILKIFNDYRNQLREDTLRNLVDSKFREVTVIGRAKEVALDVSQEGVIRRWPRIEKN